MKNLSVSIVGLLMVVGPAFGATQLAITGPATVNPGEPIAIEISLVAADVPIASWSGDLTGTGLSIEPFAGAGNHYNAANGWSASGFASGWNAAGQDLPVALGDFCMSVPTASIGKMFSAKLFAAAPGDYTINLSNVVVGNEAGDEIQDQGLQISSARVMVLPEPVSALLLLAGLPMLRRRR